MNMIGTNGKHVENATKRPLISISVQCHVKGRCSIDEIRHFTGHGSSIRKNGMDSINITFVDATSYQEFMKRILETPTWKVGKGMMTFGDVDVSLGSINENNNNSVETIRWKESINPFRSKFDLAATGDAEIPLYNISGVVGMFYDMIEEARPRVASNLHGNNELKSWSFSPVKFDRYTKTDRKGYYKVRKGSKASWFFNTLDPNVIKLLLHSWKEGRQLHLYTLPLKIERVIAEDHSYDRFPDEVSSVTMQLHTPTVFMKRRKKGRGEKERRVTDRFEFNGENFLRFQLWKLEKAGLIGKGVDVESISPLFRVLRDDTTERSLFVTRGDGKGVVGIRGKQGFVTFKLNGTMEEREMIWEILRLSTFVGIGSKTGMGFGHASIKSWR